MACTPLSIQTGLFVNADQAVWKNFNEAPVAGKSASYGGGTLTVTGPNGTTFFTPVAGQAVRHRFFGSGNFMAVLLFDTGGGPGTRTLLLIDFTTSSITSHQLLMVSKGIWLPFFLLSPKGELVDANFVPPGFQLRSGFTATARFLDFRLPTGECIRYAGRWKIIVRHDGRACRGSPVKAHNDAKPGFLPRECRPSEAPVAIGPACPCGACVRR